MSGSQPGLGAAHASSRSAILDLIRAAGTISRVELTRATGLTAATISTVVRRLIDDGLVLEVGRAESTGGKPRMLLQLDPSARYAVGVHLDHAGITYVIANLGGAIERATPKLGREARTADEARLPPFAVVYEDDDVVVVDKPSGVLTAPTPESDRNNLASLLARRPGGAPVLVVHRIDLETSGLLVFAKTEEASTAFLRITRDDDGHAIVLQADPAAEP